MHSERERQALLDIRENILLAQEFIAGVAEDALDQDRMRFFAVTRCPEIISEASRRLSSELRDRHPNLPWPAIMASGNVYRHEYDNVEAVYIWRTVRAHLPPLLTLIEIEIAPTPDASG